MRRRARALSRAQASAVGLSMDTPTRVPLSFLSSLRDEEISLGIGIHTRSAPDWFAITRESLRKHGLVNSVEERANASGKLLSSAHAWKLEVDTPLSR